MENTIKKLNKDIVEHFPHLYTIEEDYVTTFEGVSRMVMLDRYSQKDINHTTLGIGDIVVTVVKDDPTFPVRGIGRVVKKDLTHATILLEEEYRGTLEVEEAKTGKIRRHLSVVDKPLELYFEQIAKRVGYALSDKEELNEVFFKELRDLNIVPAGRVLHGAGSGNDVTWFNCFSGDTEIHTDEGSFAFEDLVGQTVNALTIHGEYRPAEIKSFGEQELYKITFETGEVIEATADHEWLVADDRKGYNHTKPRVFTKNLEGLHIYQEVTKPKTRDEAEVRTGIQHGIVYGDGTYSKERDKTRVLLFNDKEELAKHFEPEYEAVPHYKGEYIRVDNLPNTWKELPTEASNDYWYGFVLGLLATDGHVDSRGAARIFSSNFEELEVIQENIRKTGLIGGEIGLIREKNPYNGEYAPNYGLSIKKHSLDGEDILNPHHLRNFKKTKKSNRRPTIKVVSVEATGKVEEVYCGVEEETHTLVVGSGVLTGNCYVMPFPKDSRGGLADHRKEVMEIMSRGGGVGTNGSTLRPRGTIAKSVGGKSSGAVSWLNDLANLTHLVEQG